MAPLSRILALEIPWTEKPGLATVHRVAKSQTQLSDLTLLHPSGVLSAMRVGVLSVLFPAISLQHMRVPGTFQVW